MYEQKSKTISIRLTPTDFKLIEDKMEQVNNTRSFYYKFNYKSDFILSCLKCIFDLIDNENFNLPL